MLTEEGSCFVRFGMVGSHKRRYGFGLWTARGVMVSQGQLATVDHGLEWIPFLGCASRVVVFFFLNIRMTCRGEGGGMDFESDLQCARCIVAEGGIDI